MIELAAELIHWRSDSRRSSLARGASRGELHRVLRGTYIPSALWSGLSQRDRHLLRMHALESTTPGRIFGAHSAALAHGLPVVGDTANLALVVPAGPGGHRSPSTRTLHRRLSEDHLESRDGLRITSAARTVVDVACTRPFRFGLATADAALRSGLVTRGDLREALRQTGPATGIAVARRVVELADAASESAGESLSRGVILDAGLATPELQAEFDLGLRQHYRVDFAWRDAGVVGEFDGRSKYGSEIAEEVWKEKVREDALRASTGFRVVRWTWEDAWRRGPLLARLRDVGVAQAGSRSMGSPGRRPLTRVTRAGGHSMGAKPG